MRRLVVLAVLLAAAIAAAAVADHPGRVDIAWQGWEIDTSVGVLVAVLAVAAALLWSLFALIVGIARLPDRFRRNRRERRRLAGERAVTRGLAALAAGDAAAAQRHAGRAEALLPASPLTLLVAAQSAQLAGDEAAAHARYLALLDSRDGEFLGLRGLIGQALKSGDSDDALRLARRAQGVRPNALWVFETLFTLEIEAARWEAAREALEAAVRRHLVPEARAAHHRAVILYQLSLAAEAAGDTRRALSLAANAASLAPDLAPLAARQARLLIAAERRRAARRVIERAWRVAPHPELARLWGELGGATPALELVGWFERLAAQNPDAPESHIALAEAALAAQLWGEARRHLGVAIAAAAPAAPSRRLCLMMARLEDAEHPQSATARDWLDRALAAPADAAFVCAACHSETREWQAVCPTCRGFATLGWRTPSAAPEAAPPAERLAAPSLVALPGRLASAGQPDA